MSKKEQMDAVSEALGVETPEVDEGFEPMPIQDINDDPTIDPPAPDAEPPADDPPAPDAEEPGDEPGDKKDGEGEGDAPPAEEGVGEPDPAAALAEGSKKPSDEFGELSKDTPEKTRERFNTLKSKYDEVHDQAAKLQEQNEIWMDSIRSTKTNPDQLGAMFQYLEYVNSADPEKLEKAYDVLASEVQTLGRLLGKEAPAYDPLADHQDLAEKVENGYLERTDALEIARARALQQTKSAVKAQNDQQQTASTTRDSALRELHQIGQQLRNDDSLFQQKFPELQAYVKQMVSSGVPPEQWASMVKFQYSQIKVQQNLPPRPTPQPNSLRPGGVGENRGVHKEPGSALEAVKMALGQA